MIGPEDISELADSYEPDMSQEDREQVDHWLNEMDMFDCNMVETEGDGLSPLISNTCPARWEAAVTSQGNGTHTLDRSVIPESIAVDVRSGFSAVPHMQDVVVRYQRAREEL
jgi:hypothetical protein